MSIEKAREQCFFWDTQGLLTSEREYIAHHKQRFARKLPPMKQALASQQLKSRYLATLLAKAG